MPASASAREGWFHFCHSGEDLPYPHSDEDFRYCHSHGNSQCRHSGGSRTSAQRAERPKDGPEGASAASHPALAFPLSRKPDRVRAGSSRIPASPARHSSESWNPVLLLGISREPTRVPAGSSRIPAGRFLSLACPRERNQREGHPDSAARRASCPAGAWSPAGIRRWHLHVPTANARASCARPCGPDRPAPTGADGARKEQRAPARRSQSNVAFCGTLALASAARKAAPWFFRVPLGRGERAQTSPAGAARGIAPRLPSAQGGAVGKPRSALAQSRAQEERGTAASRVEAALRRSRARQGCREEGAPWMASCAEQPKSRWASKEKSPARRDAGRKRMDAGRSSQYAQKHNWIPAFAGMTRRRSKNAGRKRTDATRFSRKRKSQRQIWIPAFAGMTALAAFRRNDGIGGYRGNVWE